MMNSPLSLQWIFAACLPGSWGKLGIWATLVSRANPGYELGGAYHPPQGRVKQCGPSGRENRLGLPRYNLEASQQATVHAVLGDIWTAPGCVLMALGWCPLRAGKETFFFFFLIYPTFQFRLKAEMSAWFYYWQFSVWCVEIKRGS